MSAAKDVKQVQQPSFGHDGARSAVVAVPRVLYYGRFSLLEVLAASRARVLCVRQPYASALVDGVKDIENRSMETATGWIAVRSPASISVKDKETCAARYSVYPRSVASMPVGCLLGFVFVSAVVPYEHAHGEVWAERWAGKKGKAYCWRVQWAIALNKPVPVSTKAQVWGSLTLADVHEVVRLNSNML